jgi:hypothetical protein
MLSTSDSADGTDASESDVKSSSSLGTSVSSDYDDDDDADDIPDSRTMARILALIKMTLNMIGMQMTRVRMRVMMKNESAPSNEIEPRPTRVY